MLMEGVNAKSQMAKIRNFEKGFMAVHLINIADKLGIFNALNQVTEGLTIKDLALKLDIHEPYVKIWCQTMYHFEVLDCDQRGKFRLQPYLDEILGDRDSFKNYLGNITLDVDVIGKVLLSGADECFRTGNTLEVYNSVDNNKVIYESTKKIFLAYLFMVFPKNEYLEKLLHAGIKFLDIGCGNGMLIIRLAESFPKSIFTGIDIEKFGIEEAEAKINELELEERVSVLNISGEDMEYQNEFDMINMVITLHEIYPEVREKVIQKAYAALKKKGYLLILDFPYPSCIQDFRDPAYDYGILDQCYEMCMGTVHLSRSEQDYILKKVGFKNLQRMPVVKGMFDFITAVK